MVNKIFGSIDKIFGSIDDIFGSIENIFGSIDKIFGSILNRQDFSYLDNSFLLNFFISYLPICPF
jgi:rRNA processing protein Gar1